MSAEQMVPAPEPDSLSPLEGNPSLPARACIPWTYSTPPYRATACGSTAVFADGRTEKARYDADSHLLERRTTDASGVLVSTETHSWKDGLEQRGRVDYADGRFEQTEWTYGPQYRLLKRVQTGWYINGQIVVEFTYDSKGRIAQVTRRFTDQVVVSTYTYDAQGRLVSIDTPDTDYCASGESRCATFSYWPNGKLKREEGSIGRFNAYGDDYNQLGQLINSTVSWSEEGIVTTRAYDASGRLIRLRESLDATTMLRDTLTTTFFDPNGSRERFAQDLTQYMYCDTDVCPQTHRRVTRRTTFICNTQIIALDEWDSNEDGVVDAHRTHERDNTGRLVHEEYSGTPGLDDGPIRRDFFYSNCH